jgi:hypothetical protein
MEFSPAPWYFLPFQLSNSLLTLKGIVCAQAGSRQPLYVARRTHFSLSLLICCLCRWKPNLLFLFFQIRVTLCAAQLLFHILFLKNNFRFNGLVLVLWCQVISIAILTMVPMADRANKVRFRTQAETFLFFTESRPTPGPIGSHSPDSGGVFPGVKPPMN